ncbi:MAG TPA: YbaB/EbfC family nucleoid-associated protein [Amycolatopsis sp.]|nr:YbaB/EbfC family nucleoid-associated protein [Amycolatopsis sp.]
MSDEAERLLRRIEAIDTAAANTQRRTESYERMADEMKAVTASVTSPDGAVTVVVGPGGDVEQITFGERVGQLDSAALSASVRHTLAAAKAAAARLQAEVVRRGLGDSDLLDKVLAEDERLFGDRPPADPGPAPVTAPPRRRREVSREDDYFEDFDVFGQGR